MHASEPAQAHTSRWISGGKIVEGDNRANSIQ